MNSDTQQIAVVTGANHGIGFETAVGMANEGYRVVMACRNLEKAESAKALIAERVPSASLDIAAIDLGDLASVRAFAHGFRETYGHIDVLINNAGILSPATKTSINGVELQFATNYLGHFLLTALLIDLMPDKTSSRIVHLSSLAHKNSHINFDDLHCGNNGLTAYGQSKLACLLFGDELDRRLRALGRNIKSITVHPGGSDSGLFDEMSRWQYYLFKVVAPFVMNSQKMAAKPSLFAALGQYVEGGAYYGPQGYRELRGRVGKAKRDPVTKDEEVAKRLWTMSEDLIDQQFILKGDS